MNRHEPYVSMFVDVSINMYVYRAKFAFCRGSSKNALVLSLSLFVTSLFSPGRNHIVLNKYSFEITSNLGLEVISH